MRPRFPGDPLLYVTIKPDSQTHIHLFDPAACRECANKPCTYVCPSQVFEWEEDNLKINYPRCVECGACRLICSEQNLHFEYPRGGCGVVYQH